jgi:type I restriction enzyme S subunit
VFGTNGPIGWTAEPLCHEAGIIVGRKGAYRGVQFSPEPFFVIDTAYYLRLTSDDVDLKWAYYKLLTVDINRMDVGAAIPTTSRDEFYSLSLTYPARDKQRKDAAILSAYDDLIENNRRRMALLEEAARQLYREWFIRLRFPGHEHTRIIHGVPEGWKRMSLAEVCTPRNGIQTGPFGSQLHQSDYTDDGVPVVMPKDIINFRVNVSGIARVPEFLADQLGRHRMQEGDVVYGRRGDIGRRGFISRRQAGWLCGTGSLRLRPNADVVASRYFFDALGAPDTAGTITARAKGSTMPNLNATIMAGVPLLVPPYALQREYTEGVEPSFEMIETLVEQAQKLGVARDLLLPRLMSGEIQV